MKILGKCYCGAVEIEIPRKPRLFTDCNCSLCRKYGALWAYFLKKAIRISCSKKSALQYSKERSEKTLRIAFCKYCGCVTHYDWGKKQSPSKMMAVNGRMFDLELLESIPVRKLDGARHWKQVSGPPTYPSFDH
jgi:hypothetical protein